MPNTLLGPVTVQPATVRPGEPVLIQACDTNGKPYAENSGVTIAIQGVPAVSRYYQFSTAGTRKLTVRATKGSVDEISVVTVTVAGAPMLYRRSLNSPAQTAMPIIHASLKLGSPYTAHFTLDTPIGVRALLAKQNATPPPGGDATKPAQPAPNAPAEFTAFAKALEPVPVKSVAAAPLAALKLPAGVSVKTSAAIGSLAQNIIKALPTATSYKWDFGDGTTLTTQSPTATHDYFPAIQSQNVSQNFNVTCTVVHDNITVTRTLALVSAYGVSKKLGSIVPHYNGDDYAVFQHVGFSGSIVVHNIEPESITLNRMAIVPISDSPSVDPPAPQFVEMKTPVTIPANGSVGLGVYVTKDQLGKLGPNTSGFTVYYSGNTNSAITRFATVSAAEVLRPTATLIPAVTPPKPAATGLAPIAPKPATTSSTLSQATTSAIVSDIVKRPVGLPPADVRFSHTFRIRLTDSGRVASLPSLIFNHALALSAVSVIATDAKTGVSASGAQAIDTATNTVAIPLSAGKTGIAAQTQIRAAVQAGLGSLAAAAGAIPAATALVPLDRKLAGPPPANPVIAAGNVCDPDNISDADAASAKSKGLACQLTNQTEQVLMPSSFQNAQKGDVILSPGQDGADNMIGALLRSLNPPQYHSHSGLMTNNYFEITHCTASPDRMTASNNLTGIGGAGGVQPDVLEYAWPGSITQTIDAAVGGERWNDPADASGNTSYTISGFNPEPLGIENGNNDFILVYPMVVKPLPENETAVRPKLRQAADLARSKGAAVDANGNLIRKGGCYYCFYGYTKPEIAAGFTDPAPASAGWAAGLSPAVCSAFVWLSMKAAGIPLVGTLAMETAAELTASSVAAGAEVGATTLDGLFYYPQAERQAAAQVLDTIIYNEAEQHEGFAQYIPILGTTIATDIADQILNMFAYNDPNMYGDSKWKQSGDANAVSPDNIMWWNPPYFGYAEQLQYLEAHVEEYTVSTWQKVTVFGTVSGKVTRQDTGAVVSGVHVSLNDSLTATTDGSGKFSIPNVPAGSYNLKAWAVVTIGGSNIQIGNGDGGPSGQGQKITTTSNNPNLDVGVVLQTLPDAYRRLDLQFQWNSDHGDANPWHNSGVRYEGPNTASIPLGPGSDGFGNTGSYKYSYDYDGNGLFRCEYDWTASLLEDLSIQVTLTGKMIDDGSGDEETEYTINFNVPKDGQNAGWWIQMEHDGFSYHNGPAKITGTATNSHLTS